MAICEICGQRADPPNLILVKGGHPMHLGCLADDYRRIMRIMLRLYDAGIGFGTFGPWSDRWTDEDSEMWDKLDDLSKRWIPEIKSEA